MTTNYINNASLITKSRIPFGIDTNFSPLLTWSKGTSFCCFCSTPHVSSYRAASIIFYQLYPISITFITIPVQFQYFWSYINIQNYNCWKETGLLLFRISTRFVGHRYTTRPWAPAIVSCKHDQKVHSLVISGMYSYQWCHEGLMEECSRRLDRSRRSHVHRILFLFLAESKPLSQWTSLLS